MDPHTAKSVAMATTVTLISVAVAAQVCSVFNINFQTNYTIVLVAMSLLDFSP